MANRIPLIAGNWKMHKTCEETERDASALAGLVKGAPVDVMIAPPFTALATAGKALAGSKIALAGQNLHWEPKGAFTGEVSAQMLVSAGCSQVIIGHSERRQYFGETDETVNKKIAAAIGAGLLPVVCVGETEAQREAGETFSVLDKQVQKALEGFSFEPPARLVIAYEPVWAIGTGKTATSAQAQEAHAYIRGLVEKGLGKATAETVRILYGGSVKPDNAAELMAQPDIDGALVGGASLDPEVFSRIVHFQKG
ncbi:MAG: triose-phosphate isomerase [Desulfobacterales bacterium]|jgi:triosephosphate isomerase